MKKSILVVIAVIVIAGLAFYMGRQSAPTPVVENPPAESSAPDADKTPEETTVPETMSTPGPTPADTSKTEQLSTEATTEAEETSFNGYTQDEVYAIYEKEYQTISELVAMFPDIYDSYEDRINGEVNGTAREVYGSIGSNIPANHREHYLAWRNEFHPDDSENEKIPSANANGNNKVNEQKPTVNPPESKPESTGPDPNQSTESTNIPENPSHVNQLTWEDLADGGEMEDMDGGNSDKPIDNSHLKNHG